MKRLIWFLLFAAVVACFEKDGRSQNPVQFQPTTVDPTGQACNSTRGNLKTPDGKLYSCQNGTMAQVGGGGGVASGATLPATCNVGDTFSLTSGTIGLYGCYSANNWTFIGPITSTVAPGNHLWSGCGVQYVSGLTFTVGACSYQIGITTYNSPTTSVTLAAADVTNPRIDLIGVDVTGAVFSVTGTPAASPAEPAVDPSTQIPIIFVTIPANATTPSGISTTTIYDENTEWTCTPTANINCASTNNPYHLTKDVEATAAVLGNNFTLVKPAAGTTDLSTVNNLVFYIRSKATWPSGKNGANAARSLTLTWLSGATQVGNSVALTDGAFGFSSSTTASYQQISIPISLFGTGTTTVTTLRVQVTGNTGTSSIGWYIDFVTLQAGSASIPKVCQGINTLTFSATPIYDLSLGCVQTITLTGNVTSSTAINGLAGQAYSWLICQNGTGNFTHVWPTTFLGQMTIGLTASECSAQRFIFNGTSFYATDPGVINQ